MEENLDSHPPPSALMTPPTTATQLKTWVETPFKSIHYIYILATTVAYEITQLRSAQQQQQIGTRRTEQREIIRRRIFILQSEYFGFINLSYVITMSLVLIFFSLYGFIVMVACISIYIIYPPSLPFLYLSIITLLWIF